MLPIWIFQKGLKLLIYAAVILALVLIGMAIYNEDSVDDHHEFINEKLSQGVSGLSHMASLIFNRVNMTTVN